MRSFSRGLLLVLALVSARHAAARNIYVSNVAGNDTFAGTQESARMDRSGPVRTIAKALRLAHPGDQIVLHNTGKPYREGLALVGSRHSGNTLRDFAVVGNGAVLDGSEPVPAGAWEHYREAVFRFRPRHLGPQQLFLDGRPADRVPVADRAGSPPPLEPLQWTALRGVIYFCVEQTKLPADYDLSYAAKRTGITLLHVHDVTVRDLVVQGFQVDGIHAHTGATKVTLNGVVCRGNARAGVAVGGAAQVELQNCLLGDNGRAQLLTMPWSETHLHGSEVLSNTAPAWVDRGGAVYLGDRLIEGGLDEPIVPEPEAEATGEAAP
jgi:hypothetical protein